MSKLSQDETLKEEITVAADIDIDDIDTIADADQAEEIATDELTEKVAEPTKDRQRVNWSRVFAFGVLPALALVLAMAAGFLKWQDNSLRDAEIASEQALQAARENTIALLSYEPDTVEHQLGAARDRLTGDFRDSYTSLVNDIVIPGAKQKQISAVATVPAAVIVSAEPNHAVALVFVNQTVVMGQDAPTDTASSVRVALDKVGDRWLISKFDPV